MAKDSDLISDALEQFKIAEDAESENRQEALDDIRFARLGEQWPEEIANDRAREQRPMLTINRMPSFCRQVVNDARQNKPSITTRPATGGANIITANLFDGLIRQIQNQSSASIAYDTGIESAVYGGFGYWRVDVDYAYNDSFDLDILILAIENPFCVYGDPIAGGADSRDWNFGFVVDDMPNEQFQKKYPDAEPSGFSGGDPNKAAWASEKTTRVAEWWSRTVEKKKIVKLSDGRVLDAENFLKEKPLFDAMGLTVTGERETPTHKVMHRIITSSEVLSEKEWAGCYIPIIPCYGDVVNVEGVRYFRSLIRDAKDPQKMFNFWRTAATEIVALAPRVPYIGARGAFNTDSEKWDSINRTSHSHVEYDPVPGQPPPVRQSLDGGIAAGALQEAMNASDDMKAVMGIFDASLGAKSNETSGRAIMARQREGDTSTFHFIDNRDRAIEHTGRILVDLIPKVYTGDRIVTILSEDMKEAQVNLGQPIQLANGMSHVFDLTAGKYSLVMKRGLSYTSKREEAAAQQIEFAKVTGTGALFGDVIAKNMDWPGADVIEERIKASLPPHVIGKGPSPQEQQLMQAMQQMQAALQQMQAEIQKKDMEIAGLKAGTQADLAKTQVDMEKVGVEKEKVEVEKSSLQIEAQRVMNEAMQLQQQAEGAKIDTNALSQAMQALQQQITGMAEMHQQMMQTVAKPRKKKGRAVKQQDGTWTLESVEVPDQQPMQ
jgi:hypothetical protein